MKDLRDIIKVQIVTIFDEHEIDELSISSLPTIVEQLTNFVLDQRDVARTDLITAMQERG